MAKLFQRYIKSTGKSRIALAFSEYVTSLSTNNGSTLLEQYLTCIASTLMEEVHDDVEI